MVMLMLSIKVIQNIPRTFSERSQNIPRTLQKKGASKERKERS